MKKNLKIAFVALFSVLCIYNINASGSNDNLFGFLQIQRSKADDPDEGNKFMDKYQSTGHEKSSYYQIDTTPPQKCVDSWDFMDTSCSGRGPIDCTPSHIEYNFSTDCGPLAGGE